MRNYLKKKKTLSLPLITQELDPSKNSQTEASL